MAFENADIEVICRSGAISSEPTEVVQVLESDPPAFETRFYPGEVVCQTGDRADRMWIILEGQLDIYGDNEDGTIRLPVNRGVGEIAGEQGLLDKDSTRKATMKSGRFTRVATILRDGVYGIDNATLREQVWRNLARILSKKLTQATQHRIRAFDEIFQVKNILEKFTNEFSRRTVEEYLSGKDPFRRVEAVFWFSDVVGFSPLADTLEHDEVAKVIRSVMELQTLEIEKQNGFVDKFMGDGLMAFWPKEGSLEETCIRALAAALKFQNGIPQEQLPETAIGLDLRIGLHAGEAVYGNFGAPGLISQTFLGTDVNRCARCEQAKETHEGISLKSYRIRASQEFRNYLSQEWRSKLPTKVTARVKHGETFDLYCR